MRIENVKIVNYNRTINNADIEIENGKISKIVEKDGVGSKIVVPGFIDTHTHGLAGKDFMDGKEAVEHIAKEFKNFGVTSIFATIMTRDLETMKKSLSEIAEAKSEGANILGIHTEGPFISLEKKGAHNPDEIINGDITVLRQMQNAAKGMIKKNSYAPENCNDDFIQEMLDLGIMPTVGHTNCTFERAIQAIEKGSLHCTHLWNAMSGVVNRNPGAAEAIIYDDRIYAELIADFIHVDKETLLFTLKTKGPDQIVLVTDSIRAAGLPDGESESGGFTIIKQGAKITIKGTDTIAGSGATMHDCFKNIISLGIELEDAVKMSSYNAAKSLELRGKGVIQEGMDADIVIMDKELNIVQTLVNGK